MRINDTLAALSQQRQRRRVRRHREQNPAMATRPAYSYDPEGVTNRALDLDLLYAKGQPVLAETPSEQQFLERIRAMVTDHFRNGGIDDGTAAAFDHVITEQISQYRAAAHRWMDSQIETLQSFLVQEIEDAHRLREHAAAVRAQLIDADENYVRTRNALLGREATTAWQDTQDAVPPMRLPGPGGAQKFHTMTPGEPRR